MFLFHIMLCFGFSDLDLRGTLADACSIIFAMYWLCWLLSTHIATVQLQRVPSHIQQNSSNSCSPVTFPLVAERPLHSTQRMFLPSSESNHNS